MATRQYIGARYVPKFYQNSVDGSTQWENNVVYDPLIWVTLQNGHLYISKKEVPATVGSPAQNIDYWLDVGSYDGYIQQLQDEIDALDTKITEIETGTFVTPEYFGAKGDGVTDDSAAFALAIASSRFVVLTGKYLLHDVAISTPVYILGVGGEIVSDTTNQTAPFKNIFTISSDGVVIDGVKFTNDFRYTGGYQRNTAIVASTIKDITIKNCEFVNFGYGYNNVDTPIWNYTPVILKCVDVKETCFEHNYIEGGGGDELFIVVPHNLTTADAPTIHFNHNRMMNLVRGASINLQAAKIEIKDNYYYGFNYGGSIYNLSAYECYISHNTYENCTSGSVYDGVEDGSQYLETVIIDGDVYHGSTERFVVTSSKNITLINSEVEAGSFIFNDLGTKASNNQPTMLQNTGLKANGNVIVKNNNFKVFSTGGSLIRTGIGILHASEAAENTFPQLGICDVSDNHFKYNSFFGVTNKAFVQSNGLFKAITIANNYLDNPCTDNLAGSRRLLYEGDNRNINTSFKTKSLTVVNNSANYDSSIQGLGIFGVLPPTGISDYKAFEYVNAYWNNANTQVVGTAYDNLRTDIV